MGIGAVMIDIDQKIPGWGFDDMLIDAAIMQVARIEYDNEIVVLLKNSWIIGIAMNRVDKMESFRGSVGAKNSDVFAFANQPI